MGLRAMLPGKQKGRQTGRWADSWAARQPGRQLCMQAKRWARDSKGGQSVDSNWAQIQAVRQRQRQIGRQAGW